MTFGASTAPAVDVSNADHGGLQGRDGARDDRLQRHDIGGLRHRQVRRQVSALAAVAAGAREGHVEGPTAGHDRPGARGDHAHRQPRGGVQRVDGVAREALEQAVLEHRGRPAQALLRGLEDDVHRAPEVAVGGQPASRPEQHRGVAVVAASMHHAGCTRRVGEAGLLDE